MLVPLVLLLDETHVFVCMGFGVLICTYTHLALELHNLHKVIEKPQTNSKFVVI